MPVTSDFNAAVRDKNIRRVRIMMKDSLVRDPSFAEFEEMRREAERGIGAKNLYDKHDGESFTLNKSDWNKSYMNNQLVDLMANFSRERINHLKNVCSFIYADEIQAMKQRSQANINQEQSRHDDTRSHKNKNNNKLWWLVLIIAAAAAISIILWHLYF